MSVRRAVITGGSSGIGKSIAVKFENAGIETTICDISENSDNSGSFYSADLARPEQIDSFVRQVRETGSPPDILVCNAGRGIHEKLTEGDPDVWEQIFRLNLFSAFRLIREFVPDMVKNSRGDVVFISSVSSVRTYPYGGIYAASKAALDTLAETLRIEVQPAVRTTVIRPGVVDTDFFKNMISGSQTPEGIGWGALHPDHIADMVLYAISLESGTSLNEIIMRPAGQPL